MKIQESKLLLQKAISQLDSFGLREVRYHVWQALEKLAKIEKKQGKKATQEQETKAQTWNDMLRNGIVNPNPNMSKRMIDIITQMIKNEQEKLDEVGNKKPDDLLND